MCSSSACCDARRSVLHRAARIARRIRGTDVPAATVRCRDELDEHVVALTFDDGPSEWTEPILDILGPAGAKATFFVIGDAIAGRERTLQRICDEGHELGNHTMRHVRLDTVTRRTIARELAQADEAVRLAVGVRPAVFRPPGFRHTQAVLEVARAAGFDPVILASAATGDWEMDSGEMIVDDILERVRPGGIIDLHDGRPPSDGPNDSRPDRLPTVAAVALLLQRMPSYEFVTVSELLAR